MSIKLGFTESPTAIRLNTNGRAVKTVPMFPAILPNIDRIYFEHTMRSVWALYHMLNIKWNHSEHIGVDYMTIKSVSVRIDERNLSVSRFQESLVFLKSVLRSFLYRRTLAAYKENLGGTYCSLRPS